MNRFVRALGPKLISLCIVSNVVFAQHEQHTKDIRSEADTVARSQHHDSPSTSDSSTATDSVLMREVVQCYLDLSSALAKDKSKEAAKAGVALASAFKKLDKEAMSDDSRKVYEQVESDAREHAEHIAERAGDIEHQREHFDRLSKDMYELVKAFGGGKTLYKAFCPMYNDGKGAMWLSDAKAIKNPYYGKKMLTCGSVKEELK